MSPGAIVKGFVDKLRLCEGTCVLSYAKLFGPPIVPTLPLILVGKLGILVCVFLLLAIWLRT